MSITRRTLTANLFLILVVLPTFAWTLNLAFTRAVTESFDARLVALLNVVIAELDVQPDGQIGAIGSLGDRRFEEVYSGWYWQLATDDTPIEASRSLWDQRLTPNPDGAVGNLILRDGVGPEGQLLRVAERDVLLPGYDDVLHVMVGGDVVEIQREITSFQSVLGPGIAVIAGLLVVFLWLQLRWSLAPLRAIQRQLSRLKRGHQRRLEGDFPVELQGVASALNDVLERDERLMQRGRETATNLAHSLKTPLSVLKSHINDLPTEEASLLNIELQRMQHVIQYQLARATAAGGHSLLHAVDVEQSLNPVLAMFSHLAVRSNKQVTWSGGTFSWMVPSEDVQEIVGNLIENAFKYAESTVLVTLDAKACEVNVEDDGPGLSDSDIHDALTRGVRLDEQQPGTGIGLAVVKELVEAYHGQLRFFRSELGGLGVAVRFQELQA